MICRWDANEFVKIQIPFSRRNGIQNKKDIGPENRCLFIETRFLIPYPKKDSGNP